MTETPETVSRTGQAMPAPLARPGTRLFLTSATLLFVELLLIRWIPANVTYVGFFTNFVLMGCFLGIGVGILLGRGADRIARVGLVPFSLLLLGVVGLVARAQLSVQVKSTSEVFFGLAESHAAETNFFVLPLVVGLATLVMAALALPLGPLLRSMPPLRAYAIDIAGSLAGIAAFAGLSAAWTSPIVWFSVVAGLFLLLELGGKPGRWSLLGGAAFAGILTILATAPGFTADRWSPYYRITTYPSFGMTFINVNGIAHQFMAHVGEKHLEPFRQEIYNWFPGRAYPRVCIVGAGSGTDVALTLAEGAGHVDAVEIDPLILSIGVEQNPNAAYQDPRVERFVDDGRHFMSRTDRTYDLVIFALPDSLTLASSTANLRLESFLFTLECFERVRQHLSPDGVFVLYNFYRAPWIVDRIASMLEKTFGAAPLVRRFSGMAVTLADGPLVAHLHGPPPGDGADPPSTEPIPRPAVDDWPFLYLKEPSVPTHYLNALAIILTAGLLLVGGAVRVSGAPLEKFSLHFFALGAAFLLLETRSLVTFSLLFGNTWLVNAFVFFAILVSVLLAILVNAFVRVRRPWIFYAVLLASLAAGFALPPESLLIEPAWLRYVLASALAFAPVFCANLVFTSSFRDTRTADMAFASNLLGAMLAGALEYLSLIVGYRMLMIVVAGLYGMAFLFSTKLRFFGDKDLATAAVKAGPS